MNDLYAGHVAGPPATVQDVSAALTEQGYLPDHGLATAVYLAMRLERPLLLEGEAGVGKTEVAKVLAGWTGGELIRLQCYEGIDVASAVYEWNYLRQILYLRAAEAGEPAEESAGQRLHEVFGADAGRGFRKYFDGREALRAVDPRGRAGIGGDFRRNIQ